MKIGARKAVRTMVLGTMVLTGVFFIGLILAYSPVSSAGTKNSPKETSRVAKAEKPGPMNDAKMDELFKSLHREIAEFNKTFDTYFDDEFFEKALNPLKDMGDFRNALRSEFQKVDFSKDFNVSDHIFDAWFNHRFGGDYGDIKRKEDKKYVYYQFKVDNPKKYKFTTKVHDGMVELSADRKTVTKKDQKGYTSKTVTESKLERSFPLPKNVNAEKFKTAVKGNQYIVKFPKST